MNIPKWQINEMRTRYENGESMKAIASYFSISTYAVAKYCNHIERIEKVKLTAGERAGLLEGWRV